ncbi:MAG: GNAT family N-acetyltransferase [Aquamicrobium sp.]|uniref:GNAT family N-acetyltransferase n=1 Tax=Mesorhizobium sp. Pch-S TaxID=2082387 RepID=UPI0010103296|nr:GNAT family N-acetyltransferase [Mesorhizobium sp. Pch-S]MBR2686695.1 GNAT family N-acetyltransferase [Aquamicrobium sp.]QAZ42712.1 GNAT family N-acetyltransferase [Mesorhizobium sp. Pch-S]
MSQLHIVPYDDSYRDEVLSLTIVAWASVLGSANLDQLPRFAYDAFYPEGWQARQTSDVAELLATEPDNISLALVDGKLAGFIGIRIHPKDSMGEIHIIAVAPDRQRQGVGRMLLAHAEGLIRDAGMKMVMLETTGDAGHEAARRTYEAARYTPWPISRYFKNLE